MSVASKLRSFQPFRAQQVSFRSRIAPRSMATRHGNDPDVLAKEKARNLSGTQDSSSPHKEHAPGWNEHLASDAEANIKVGLYGMTRWDEADKLLKADQAGPEGKPSKELQDATVNHVNKHHRTDDGIAGTEHHSSTTKSSSNLK
nr:hypothetical protein L203_05759 [Cryptococcus depauperatus CBS 7841]